MTPPAISDDFARLDLRVGTVVAARPNAAARKPALVLEIDFGPLGVRTSSAQIAELYAPESLVGRQVVALVGLAPRNVAGVVSEVLVLAAVDTAAGTVLLALERRVADGTRIA